MAVPLRRGGGRAIMKKMTLMALPLNKDLLVGI